MARRLYTRIYVHFVGVLLVVAIATGVVLHAGERTAFLRHTAERMAHQAAWLLRDKCDGSDALACARATSQLSDELGEDITVRGVDGTVLTSTGRELPPLTADDVHAVGGGMGYVQRGPAWFAAAPIRRHGAVVGVVETAGPRRSFRVPLMFRPIMTLVLVLVLVGIATGPLARRISLPVERLTEATHRLGEGELSYRIPMRLRAESAHADELTQLTQAWNEMAERVERLVRGQKELLANVSHDLRSPLARIRVALELLRGGADETRLRDIEGDLGELDRLIDDVLTASRLDADGPAVQLAPVDVPALLTQLGERAAHDPTVAGRSVRVEAGGPLEIAADAGLLKRALWNLVENAAKYGAPPITIAAERHDGVVAFSVADEGAGIAPSERERVLAPFYRADKARTPGSVGEKSGFGLGLTIARRVAPVHGGTISIGAGTDERGCRVTLKIPVGPA